MARDNVNLQVGQEITRLIFDANYKMLGFDECIKILEIFVKLQNKQVNSNQATTPTSDSGNSKSLCEGA